MPPATNPAPPPPARPWAARLGLALWALGTTVLCAYLLGAHLAAMPGPPADEPRLRAALARAGSPNEGGRWVALHVLSRGCRCSARVLEQLIARGPAPGYAETIVLAGDGAGDGAAADADRARAEARGFRVEAAAAGELASAYGVEAAPLLAVADPSGRVRYLGGYSERKQGPPARGALALETIAAGGAVAALPIFGCAVSERLRAAADPLGVR